MPPLAAPQDETLPHEAEGRLEPWKWSFHLKQSLARTAWTDCGRVIAVSLPSLSLQKLTVIVAVIAMRMMEVISDEIVDMITMWYGLVSASRTVNVTVFVSGALMIGRAPGGIGVRDFD
jgi:hypothetical protein